MVFAILVVIETLIAGLAIVVAAEYLLTEVFYVIRYLRTPVKTEIFLITLVIIFALNYFWPKFKRLGKEIIPLLVVVIIAMLFGYKKYQNYYNDLQREPKIYSISSNWSIQAKRIIIEGKNFGWAHQYSKVIADDEKFLVDSWTPERIVVSGPLTGNFGQHELQVILFNGQKSRKIPFKFRDPAELSWKR
jgi:hypothetical protein